jgi:hypothetical protein
MTLPTIDLATLTDAEVTQLKSMASLEEQRRIRVAAAPAQAEAVAVAYLSDTGKPKGAAWVQPTGAHDAYPLGWTVTRDAKTWESLIPANVTVPGSDVRWWKDLTTVPTPGAWSGAAVAYKVADVATYGGLSYRCLQAHTSQAGWTPVAVPALWQRV